VDTKPTASPDETTDTICGVLEVIQAKRGYRFGVESLLLPGFVKPGASELVDLGCGSGVILLVMVRFYGIKKAWGVEIQAGLADRARRSVALNHMADRIEIVEADLKDLDGILPAGKFDLVVSNPPYRPAETGQVSQQEEKALGKHEIACAAPDVVAAAARLLRPGGRFCVVFSSERLSELMALLRGHGLQPSRLRMVHGRLELSSKNCLVEAVRGGKGTMVAEPPMIVYYKSGEYTEEVKGMLYPAE
jgi:tRNA1Val (adenine37-N6)-methyltransferase